MSASERDLWQALRERRRELADEQGVPPYVIFHDTTLRAMVAAQPRRVEDLLMLPGIGRQKLERYGQAFFALITAHSETWQDAPAAAPEPADFDIDLDGDVDYQAQLL